MKPKILQILQHSLGVDKHGQGNQYRNHFATGPEGDDFVLCRELVALGYMTESGPRQMAGGMHFFFVTEAGKKAMTESSPPPPKLTRAQRRYRQWLDGASNSMKFGEWLRSSWSKEDRKHA